MKRTALLRHPYHALLIIIMIFLSSCAARKRPAGYTDSKAARAAEAMADLKDKKLYRFITDWAGVRYKLGGLDKRGIDCSGFALLLNKEIYGIDLPRRSIEQSQVINEKNTAKLKEGDLVFFSFGGNSIDHVGVYLNNGFFVHASTTRGVIVDDLNLPVYQHALVKGGPVKD